MRELISDIKKSIALKKVIIPYSNENRQGYNNVNEVAKEFNIPIIGINSRGSVFNGINE
jgi:hypothetical protein